MGRRDAAGRGAVLVVALVMASCGREREIVPLPEAPGPKSKVSLSPMELKDHESYDRLDRQVLSEGTPADLVKVYDDLARLAPEDPRVLVRGAMAALAADPETRGPAVAQGVLAKLATIAPGNADAAWLALRNGRLALAAGGSALKASSDRQAEALLDLAKAAEDFAAAQPAWKGPFGASVDDARRTAEEARLAVAAWEAAKTLESPGTAPAGGTSPAPAPASGKPAPAPDPAPAARNPGGDRAPAR